MSLHISPYISSQILQSSVSATHSSDASGTLFALLNLSTYPHNLKLKMAVVIANALSRVD